MVFALVTQVLQSAVAAKSTTLFVIVVIAETLVPGGSVLGLIAGARSPFESRPASWRSIR